MSKKWFAHEDEVEPGENEAEPMLGPRFSPFWIFGMIVLVAFAGMGLYIVFKFVASAAALH